MRPNFHGHQLVTCILLLLALVFYQDNFSTLAGDNLYATPWQRWTRGRSLFSSISRSGQVLNCAYSRKRQCFRDQEHQEQEKQVLSWDNSSSTCPSYFKWIEKDLEPWKQSGITKWSLDTSGDSAFRVFIVDGKLYVKHYYSCHHSRSMFTVWGLLMLLRRFPGQIRDVDLLFNCADRPRVFNTSWFRTPVFSYSTTSSNQSIDISFPDWSFWGWPDMGINNWMDESASIVKASKQVVWRDRQAVAQWKGDPYSSRTRSYLRNCRSSRLISLFSQDWKQESRNKFANSHRSKQCNYRYKIYAEGNAWSVSYKYIMACGSTMLTIDQEYQDFFTRALVPWFHYVPVSRHPDKMCSSIEEAVEWGNRYPKEAEDIGRRGQDFITNDLSIDRVYDYMYHLLNRYASLQSFKVMVPRDAEWVCPSYVKCIAYPSQRKQLERLDFPRPGNPCTMDF